MLLDAVRNHDNEYATHWSECASWSTLLELMKHTSELGGSSSSTNHGMDADMREAIERSLQMQWRAVNPRFRIKIMFETSEDRCPCYWVIVDFIWWKSLVSKCIFVIIWESLRFWSFIIVIWIQIDVIYWFSMVSIASMISSSGAGTIFL